MATNFTNKYMQVFQNYNEFGEHSADYVRGEDHIAFLIEENEVIYWLYLEQVWRPLNVRTTNTGELEDGRTKVTVRLEYIECGQKYTSVPNIPDPERITSMSRFLEDYPDIEEVNVSGTVNLTDLSYAFAGSKIKDFSMLDTSNVTYFNYIFKDINDETRDLFLKINQSINDIIAGDIVLNNLTIESTNEKIISTVKLGESDIKNSLIIKGNINFELIYDTLTSSKFYNFNNIKTDANVNLSPIGSTVHVNYNNINCRELTLGWNTINNTNSGYTFKTHCDKIIIENGNNDAYSARDWRKIECYDVKEFILKTRYDNPFSSGIKFNNNDDVKITINDTNIIGNFWFTTPIIDYAFYAKYAQYNIPISIFQYKTTFEEVANINISSEVDSSLLYVDWDSINFDTSNMNIEINNNIDLIFPTDKIKSFNKFIINNNNNIDSELYPSINIAYVNIFANYRVNKCSNLVKANEINITGIYNNSNNSYLWDSNLFHDVIIKNAKIAYIVGNTISNNIKFEGENLQLILTRTDTRSQTVKEIDISNLFIDNILTIPTSIDNFNTHDIFNLYLKLKYITDAKIIFNEKITSSSALFIGSFIDWLLVENAVHVNNNSFYVNNSYQSFYGIEVNDIKKYENIYFNDSEIKLVNLFSVYDGSGGGSVGDWSGTYSSIIIKNIYGDKINVHIPPKYDKRENSIYDDENLYNHIDVYQSHVSDSSNTLIWFKHLDNESTINLVTKLVDNTSSSTATIYMYRSQANIIGEENIAAAVAKNYEFAIIEN